MIKKNRNVIATIFCIVVFLSSMISISTVASQEVGVQRPLPFIGAIPNPVGVNQDVLLHVGVQVGLTQPEMGWEGLTVSVTKPDGNTETLGPIGTDSTGGTGVLYVPNQVGTYQVQTHFPEQVTTADKQAIRIPVGTVMVAQDSEILEIEVQSEPLAYYPGKSLPTNYWTRPIDGQLREWYTIAGNWLERPIRGATGLVPFNDGPETAHILWAMSNALDNIGGLAGGTMGQHSYADGDAYEGKWSGSIIIGGKLYYEKYGGQSKTHETVCVDLHTGETLWTKTFLDNRSISFGQTLSFESFNHHAAYAYLWITVGNTWHAFDPLTSKLVYTMTNVPSGTRVTGPNGEILIYTINTNNGWMTLWNSTHAVMEYSLNNATWTLPGGAGHEGSWTYNVDNIGTFDARTGMQWNVSIPENLNGNVRAIYPDNLVLGVSFDNTYVYSWAVSLASGDLGDLIFQNSWKTPLEWEESNAASIALSITPVISSAEDNIFSIWMNKLLTHYTFDLSTGEFLWSSDPQIYMDNYHYQSITTIAYNKMYSVSYGGILYAYDAATGNLEWTYSATDPYSEILWGNNWPMMINFITDGKIYIGHEEHSPIDPKPRGAPYICIDAETGEEVWRADGLFRQTEWGGRSIIGDSIIATMDTYDQRIYAIGKGPTSLTAEAPLSGVTVGSPITIAGTIMDVSSGTNDVSMTLRFPNGVPAIADEDMSDWMLYVYKQFELPADAQGVTVILCAIDPNGNYMDIDRTTSDIYGKWALGFIPEMEGTYQIIATFEGSNSYYGSTTTTYVTVGSAPAVATPIEPEEPEAPVEPTQTVETPFIITEAVIIAAVAVAAVIGIVAYFLLKRK